MFNSLKLYLILLNESSMTWLSAILDETSWYLRWAETKAKVKKQTPIFDKKKSDFQKTNFDFQKTNFAFQKTNSDFR